ncbi:rhodanese domain-containing protein CG4456-like [Anthonomus grandis grandis]|uniref:rhodanese domain-containing protein CG4456-like n=1 Tax=Anthonomus grandis grandis TaxID=2921223 RepID=UPI00216653B4|nr:rhodanese domain-containing protein CG4456-like [Anthonomus grandis grandis]
MASAAEHHLPQCNFEEVIRAQNDPNILVIDVREIAELRDTGAIPGSINIPLAEVKMALGSNGVGEDFEAKYLTKKPGKDTEIIFTCRLGRRSGIAQQTALQLGYTRVKNYTGGWLDWEERIKRQ